MCLAAHRSFLTTTTGMDGSRFRASANRPANSRNWRRAFPRLRGPQVAPTKKQVTLRLDPDVIDKFRATGKGWQARMNEVLKAARV